MATWTDTTLRQAIQNYLETDEVTFVGDLPIIIQQAEERIIKDVKYLPNFRKTTTGDINSQQAEITVPDDLLAINFIYWQDLPVALRRTTCIPKEESWIYEAFSADALGTPKYYCWVDDTKIRLAPIPSSHRYTLSYFYKPDSITSTSTSWIGDHMYATLLAGCLLEGYIYLKGDADLLQVYESRYKEALAADKSLIGLNKIDEYRRI